MTQGTARGWQLLGFCLVFISMGGAQSVSSATGAASVAAAVKVHPRIFRASSNGPSAQLVISGSPAAQISSTSFHPASDEELAGMEQALEKYVTAFEDMNLFEVRKVWPVMDRQHEAAFTKIFSAFPTAYSRDLELECAPPSAIAETARVECVETLTYGKPKSKLQKTGPTRIAIVLKGQSSGWVMADMVGVK
jgi:hypothetical protein